MEAPLREDPRFGVVLMDLGGPGSREELRPFLVRLLSDPRVLRMPAVVRLPLARWIAWRRSPVVWPRYEAIGGSPLLRDTEALARDLESRLGVPVAVAMRHSAPRAGAALAGLRARGVARIVALPLFPQFSTTTTASAVEDLARHASGEVRLAFLPRHADLPGYPDAQAEALRDALREVADAPRRAVLFTAHSIPESCTRRGDPYIQEIRASAARIAERAGLGGGWTLAFQSAASRGRWHGPAMEEAVDRLAASGIRALVVQPLSFVSENLETLWDLDRVLRSRCDAAGIRMVRTPTPGASPRYREGIADALRDRAREEGWLP